MNTCPECGFEIDVDEFDVDLHDELSCPECGVNLFVTTVSPLRLARLADGDGDVGDPEDPEDPEDVVR